jgi:tetratricopeptide (TPR) repeat protein
MQLSLIHECRDRAEQGLAALAAGADRDARREMNLYAALGASLRYTKGPVPEVEAACRKALDLAQQLDDAEHQLRSLSGLWTFYSGRGLFPDALAVAERFRAAATHGPDPNDPLIGDRMIGIAHHFLGDLPRARHHFEHMLAHYVPSGQKSQIIRFHIDPRASARAHLAQTLWLQGLPDQAVRAAEGSIEDARGTNHVLSLCSTLAVGACVIALLVGDFVAAERYAEVLLDHATSHALAHWRAFGRSYQGALAIARGDAVKGLPLLYAGYDGKGGFVTTLRLIDFLVAGPLGRSGQTTDGLALVEEGLVRAESTGERWAISEWLRLKGELLLMQGMPAAAVAAEDHFRQALDWARRQGALSWELRAATSLARLLRDQGRPVDAMALLQPVYDRFTEGFDTSDLKAAKALLEALAEPAAVRSLGS